MNGQAMAVTDDHDKAEILKDYFASPNPSAEQVRERDKDTGPSLEDNPSFE